MAVTEQQQPPQQQQPPVASTTTTVEMNNVTSKRQRRPSVRLGEIGDQPAAALTKQGKYPSNKASKIRPLTNLGTFEEEENDFQQREENVENLAIGSWKIKGSNSKRPRTNWASKNLDNQDGFDREFEMEHESPDNSLQNYKDFNFRAGNDGVNIWLNGLGLGRYWPVFEIHEVDEEVLPMLTLEDLKDMGITAVGTRRKMFCAIQMLNQVFS